MHRFSPFLLIIVLSLECRQAVGQGFAENVRSRPLVLLVLQDLSGSVSQNAIPRVVVPDLDPVFAHIRAHGGELAFGIVNGGHNQLMRIHYDTPKANTPSGGRNSRNIFMQLKARAEEEKARATTGPDLAAAREAQEREEQEFKQGVTRLLQARPSSSTNLIAGLDRAAVFFAEERPFDNALEVLLAVTDGEETTHRGTAYQLELKPTTLLLMVNNSATRLGIFTSQKGRVKVYESPRAAIAAILQQGKGANSE